MGKKKRGLGIFSIFLVMLVCVFLIGCQQTAEEVVEDGPYVGGIQGIQFAFQEEEPPSVVLDDGQQEFYMTLVVRNFGEFTVPVGRAIASLSGIDANAFGLSSMNTKNTVAIQGTSSDQGFIIDGAEELLEFPVANYVNNVAADFNVQLRADLCYEYKTEALTHLCLKKDVVKKSIEDVCDTTNPALSLFNSGGPVQVSGIRQKAVGGSKVQVSFTVENVGNGLVYLPATFTDACRGNEKSKDMVRVTLRNPQNNFVPECSAFGKGSAGDVRLVGGKKEITCTLSTDGLQDVSYQDLLIVEVGYMYREAVTTSLNVENAV